MILTSPRTVLQIPKQLNYISHRLYSTMSEKQKPAIWMWRGYPERKPVLEFPDELLENFPKYFDTVYYGDIVKNPDIGKAIKAAVLFAPIYKYFLEQQHLMPNLKVIANVGTGTDHIDIAGQKKKGVMVTNTLDVQSDTVADHAMALLLSAARVILPSALWLRQKGTLHLNLLGIEVNRATLGIVGLGSIGFKTAQRARGFNMKILYHQRTRKTQEEEESLGGAKFYSRLGDMLPLCDFVVVACPLTMATENMFGAKEFALMKQTAILVNVGRGQLVDQEALITALKSGQIHGAALDVTNPEPLPLQHPLLEMENVIVTPHSGTATFATRQAMLDACVDNLKAALIDDVTPPNLVEVAK